MSRAVSLFLLLILSSASLSAQMFGPPDTTVGPPKAVTTFGLGVQGLDVDGFNAALRANGFPTIDETAVVAGLSTGLRFGRWDLTFSGGAILGGGEEGSAWRTKVSGNSLMVGAGYALIDGGRWRVVPSGGVGLARIGYHIEQVRGGPLDSALVDPLRGTDLEGQTKLWHAGVGVDYRLGQRVGKKVSISARVGYSQAFGESDWKADDNDLSSGPRATYGGVYARLGLSFGIPKRKDALFPALFSIVPWLSR